MTTTELEALVTELFEFGIPAERINQLEAGQLNAAKQFLFVWTHKRISIKHKLGSPESIGTLLRHRVEHNSLAIYIGQMPGQGEHLVCELNLAEPHAQIKYCHLHRYITDVTAVWEHL